MLGQLLALSTGLNIFLLIVFLLAVPVASYFLFLDIRREHKRARLSRYKLKDLKKEQFGALLKEMIEGENARSFSVIFAEFNTAKEFKETYGEAWYAWALGTIRERIASVLPKGSKVCLYEYDTYAFLLEGELTEEELGDYAAKCITKGYAPVPFGRKKGQKELPDLVIGAAAYNVNDVETRVEDFLRNLEIALAVSGREGLNDYVVFTPELLNNCADYHYYRELKDAINAEEFTLYFQPIYNLYENEPIAYEATLHWDHNELGALRRDKFIHVIERSGDIGWVGLWAYEQMVIQFKKFIKIHPDSRIAFSINLSDRQLSDPKICDELYRIATKYGVPPAGICFEVGEVAVLGRNAIVAETIEKLTQCGFMTAVDNFGLETNAVLKIGEQRIFDWVKLDKRFVAKVQDGEPDIKNMQTLLDFARGNNFLVIAQDVKDALTEEFIKRIGIFCGQGYYLGKPEPFEKYSHQAEAVVVKQ